MRAFTLLLVVFTVVAATRLAGTVIEPTRLRDLAGAATLIVRGQVTDVRPVARPGRGIDSVATVAVDRVLKGEPLVFVAVRVPGGVIGRHRYLMVGAPTLRPAEQAVFFLVRDDDQAWRPVGLSAGVVRVASEMATGRLVVHPSRLLAETAPNGPIVRGDRARRAVAVDEFEAMVAVVMAATAPSGAER